MVLCSPTDVRVYANPSQISDAEITSIIAGVTTGILTKAGTTDDTDPYLIQAGIHAAAAVVLKQARAKGELASSVETPESKISITGIIEEIKQHEEERDSFINLYKESTGSIFSSTSFHAGFNSHYHRGY